MGAVADFAFLEPGEHLDLALLERSLETIGETDTIGMFEVGWGLHDDADRAARMEDEASRAGNIHERHDLRAHGENQVRTVMHTVRHFQTPCLSWSVRSR